MKAVLYPFRKDDAIIGLTRDFPGLSWAVVHSPEELAREIADAEILVTSNRVCTPDYGEALRGNSRRLRWMFFGSSGIERGVAMGIPEGVRVTNSTGVKDVAVTGVPDDEWGARVVAVVVGEPGVEPPTEDELRGWVRQRLRGSRTPDEVRFRPELPYTPTGKLLRRQLTDELTGTTRR